MSTPFPLIFGLCLSHLAGVPAAAQSEPGQPASDNSAATPNSGPTLPEIHINQRCRALSANGLSVAGTPAMLSAKAFCRLESVKTTQHRETANTNGQPHLVLATVQEQDYLLQNITGEPVVFVVEHRVPHGWQVDSEPQPASMSNSTAIFNAIAQPGQTVRLHVGLKTTLLGPLAPREPIIPGAPDIIPPDVIPGTPWSGY
jgi:hypothetical protein